MSAKSKKDSEKDQNKDVKLEEMLMKSLENQQDKTRVDFSSQGLTIVPSSLLSKMEITVLNLSSNNIRAMPTDISNLINLKILNISRNGLSCANANDFSGLPTAMETLVNLVEVNISECNVMAIPPALWKIPSIQKLDISRNKVKVIPMEIMNLANLRYLNATQTGIKTLPEEIVCCDLLDTLLLLGNPIESLPDTLREMMYLSTLAINLRIFSDRVDEQTDMMLRKQQVTNEHIPNVVFDIPKLRSLDLENSKVNNLPTHITTSLKELNISGNYFPIFPVVVSTLMKLNTLEIAENNFTAIPESLQQLKHLKVLIAHHNKLKKISNLKHLRHLEKLDLSYNQIKVIPNEMKYLERLTTLILNNNLIEELPEALTAMKKLHTLDLTSNKITVIPKELEGMESLVSAHQYHGLFKYGLWLHKNPIQNPPPKIWMTWDPKKIWHYLKEIEIQKTPNLQRCKLIVVGNEQCGKTTLVHTITTGCSQLQQENNFTIGYKLTKWTSRNLCKFMWVDCGGHRICRTIVPKLLDKLAIICVVFDLMEYATSGFHCVSYWINLIQSYCPDATVILIGTKLDLYRQQIIDTNETCSKHEETVQQESREEVVATADLELDSVLQNLQSNILSDMNTYLERLKQPLSLKILPEIHLVACDESLEEVDNFRIQIELTVVDKIKVPHLQRYIPEPWSKFCKSLKKRHGVYLEWEMVEETGESYKIKNEQLIDCIKYLMSIGNLIWLHWHPRLKNIIIHRLNNFQLIMEKILVVNIEETLDYNENQLFKTCGKMSEDEFDYCKNQLLRYGEFSWPMLKTFMFGMKVDRQTLNETMVVMEYLGIGAHTELPYLPPPNLYEIPVFIVHGMNKDADMTVLTGATWNYAVKYLFTCDPSVSTACIYEDLNSAMHTIADNRIDWSTASLYSITMGNDRAAQVLVKEEDEVDYSISIRINADQDQESISGMITDWFDSFFKQEQIAAPGLTYEKQQLLS